MCGSCFGSTESPLIDYPMTAHPPYYWGVATNGLQPLIRIERADKDWSFEMIYLAQNNFPESAWLRVTNRVGSRMKVIETNGVERPLKDASALAAWQIPVDTSVSNVMQGVERSRRVLQWWRTGLTNSVAGKLYSSTTFSLIPLYETPFTNDCTLQMSPLIYRVDSSGTTAHLIEFPVMRFKLKANGTVEKLE